MLQQVRFQMITLTFTLVLKELKAALNSRGATTTYALGRAFKNMDSYDGNKKVDKNEFFTAMKEYGLNLTSKQADV